MPCGSRNSTRRMGTGGSPVWYQTAVDETTSTVRSARLPRAPYQLATVMVVQGVLGSAATGAKVGKRRPLRRGRTI